MAKRARLEGLRLAAAVLGVAPAALTGISHKDAAACPAPVRFDKAKTAFQAQSLMVLSQGRS